MQFIDPPADAPSLDLIKRLSSAFSRAMMAKDVETAASLLAEDFEIHYNVTRSHLKRADAIAFFHSYFPTVDMRFDNVIVTPTVSGWVQQHDIHSRGADGFAVEDMKACTVVTIHGKKIGRIYEYLDSAQAGGFDSSRLS